MLLMSLDTFFFYIFFLILDFKKAILILGGKHEMKYKDDVSSNCSLETYIIVVANVTPLILILKKAIRKHIIYII